MATLAVHAALDHNQAGPSRRGRKPDGKTGEFAATALPSPDCQSNLHPLKIKYKIQELRSLTQPQVSGNEATVTALKTRTWGLGLLASQTSPFSISISRQSPSPSVGSAIYPTVASRSTQSLSFPPCANTANINAGNACNATLVEPQHGLIDREKFSKKYCLPILPCIVSASEGDCRFVCRGSTTV